MIAARMHSRKLGHEMCSLGDNAAAFVRQNDAEEISKTYGNANVKGAGPGAFGSFAGALWFCA
jgi:hypothetical protein